MSTTFNVILDTRRMKKTTGTFPVKLRVTCDRVPRDFTTIFDLTSEDYGKLTKPRVSDDLQSARDKIKEIRNTAGTFIDGMGKFNFDEFERKFIAGNPLFKDRKIEEKLVEQQFAVYDFDFTPYHKRFPIFTEDHSRAGCISATFFEYIKKLIQEGRIGSALCHQNSFARFKNFKGNVLFSDINSGYLFQFEKEMLEKGRKLGYISIVVRDLRTIYNEAISNSIVSRDLYPFGKKKYIIPKSRNNKRAIDINEIGDLYYHKLDDINESKARDFWMFCYFANGMNPKDLANLKFENFEGEYFTFNRAKTIRTSRSDPKPITVYLNDDMKSIIEKWGNKDTHHTNYVFPILEKGMTALDQHYTIRTFIKFINDRMKRLGKELNISKKLTTVVSRHSFSTQLKRSGASTEFIQESLGHTDKATTENYLDSFENEVKKEFSNKLLAFKQNRPNL
jgi:integrase/recombinase XerD